MCKLYRLSPSIDTLLHMTYPLCYHIRREIIETMVLSYAQRIFAGQRPVFDGRKNLYSTEPLPIGRDRVSLTISCTMITSFLS